MKMHPISPWLCLSVALALAPAAQASTPSFCTSPGAAAEKAICADPVLMAADRRLAPEYAAAMAKAGRRDKLMLRKEQEDWWADVRECGQKDEVKPCIAAAYESRTAELQAMYRLVEARGPFRFDCEDGSQVVVTYFATEPSGMVAVRGSERAFMLVQRSGSGARYAGRDKSFWEHQGSATVMWGADAPELQCKKA